MTSDGVLTWAIPEIPPSGAIDAQWYSAYRFLLKFTDDGAGGGGSRSRTVAVFNSPELDVSLAGGVGTQPGVIYNKDTPIAVDDFMGTPVGQLLASDVTRGGITNDFYWHDGDFAPTTGTFELVGGGPSHAASFNWNAASGEFTYLPVAGYEGLDSFTYRIDDRYSWSEYNTQTGFITYSEHNYSNVATVTIQVGKPVRAYLEVQAEEIPDLGYILGANTDDDNENGVPDSDELSGPLSGEDDLLAVELSHWLRADGYAPDFVAGLQMSHDNIIRLWDSPTKNKEILASVGEHEGDHWLLADLPETIWVEGVSTGYTGLTLAIVGRDTSMFTGMVFAWPVPPEDVTTVVMNVQEPNMQIWNGQDAPNPISDQKPNEKEAGGPKDIGHGAFTVASLNDTDGDGRVDASAQDTEVIRRVADVVQPAAIGANTIFIDDATGFQAGDVVIVGDEPSLRVIQAISGTTVTLGPALTRPLEAGKLLRHPGIDEVDMMKLLIHRPSTIVEGAKMTLTLVSGKAKVWTAPTKGPGEQVLVNGKYEFLAGDVPAEGKVLWVEATAASEQLRDIELRLEYLGGSDTVNATAVWSKVTAVEHGRKTAANILSAFPDIVDPDIPPAQADNYIVGTLQAYGGTGLIPISTTAAQNGIVIQFTAEPRGIHKEPVYFDAGRQIATAVWERATVQGGWTLGGDLRLTVGADYAIDDGNDIDESVRLTAKDHFYSYDAPGPKFATLGNAVDVKARFHLREFLRVSFVSDPTGIDRLGSRTSEFYDWHATHELHANAGVWARTTGDDPEVEPRNDVAPGAISTFFAP